MSALAGLGEATHLLGEVGGFTFIFVSPAFCRPFMALLELLALEQLLEQLALLELLARQR